MGARVEVKKGIGCWRVITNACIRGVFKTKKEAMRLAKRLRANESNNRQ